MTAGSALEQETKLRVPDAETARVKLARVGARSVDARQFEDNFILDDASSSLAAAGCLLRLRFVSGRAVITFKGPRQIVQGIKSRPEIEFEASDPSAAMRLFDGLGYRSVFRYQKYREVFAYENVSIMLDETPIGTYLEIEGPLSAIHRAATVLGFGLEDYIGDSYADLYRAAGGAGDMVFP